MPNLEGRIVGQDIIIPQTRRFAVATGLVAGEVSTLAIGLATRDPLLVVLPTVILYGIVSGAIVKDALGFQGIFIRIENQSKRQMHRKR